MAERRMFSVKIMNSAKFLKMPQECQNLYFHLGLRADDDGIVEAFTVMRLVGATEDSIKLLHAKGFIFVLNEDLVTFITDWTEHNKIRSDRKVDSIYKDLLVKILPDVKLLEPRERTDRPKLNDNVGTSQGQPNDNQVTDNGLHRLGKDRIGKDNIKDYCPKNKFSDDSLEIKIANYLYAKIKINNNRTKKPNLQSWADTINKIMRIDKYTKDEIRQVIDFSQDDSFWKTNILSAEKLRKQMQRLLLTIKSENEKPVKNVNQQQSNKKDLFDLLKEID